ncbi:MAG: metal ABC transporter ATP-binding protein [Trueperaceae bacterium]
MMFNYGGRHHANPVPNAPALEIKNLITGYPGAKAALKGVSLCVPVGTRVALVGSNGAGKSTLLKAVAGLLPIREGDIKIYGNAVGACHHRTAYLPQRSQLDWRFPISLRRLVLTGRYVHLGWLKRPTQKDYVVVEKVTAQLGLSDLLERQIGQLSGGQQQRALLARALAQESDLLLLDEPLNAVDNDTRAIITNVLNDLSKHGKTVIMATHDLGRLESDFDGAMYLADGREVPAPPGSFTQLQVGVC